VRGAFGFSDHKKEDDSLFVSLERESGGKVEEMGSGDGDLDIFGGGLGVRSGLDLVFDSPPSTPEPETDEELNFLRSCCPTPLFPCYVQHSCCISLCHISQGGLGARFGENERSGGCCPPEDPCGELLETGNCIQCDCPSHLEEEDDLLTRGGWTSDPEESKIDDVKNGEEAGIARESGKNFIDLEIRFG